MPGAHVDDDELLYRRVAPDQVGRDGKATSFAFAPRKDEDDGLSTSAASLVTPEECLGEHADFTLVSITAKAARQCGCTVTRDERDDKHILILLPEGSNRRKKIRKELALQASPVVLRGWPMDRITRAISHAASWIRRFF